MSENPHTNKVTGGLSQKDHNYGGFAFDEVKGSLPDIEVPEGFKSRHGPDRALVRPFKTHYCPGCEHGTLTRLIANELANRGVTDKSVMMVSVGCSVLAFNYINIDAVQAAHGRSPAVATGVKRLLPDHTVFMVQGDGDAAAIGFSETLQAAHRGEAITVFMVNNGIYGMTGGQMAPTTLIGGKSTTSPNGRAVALHGHPIDMCAQLAQVAGASYVRRVPIAVTPPKKEVDVTTPREHAIGFSAKPSIDSAKAIKEAFDVQDKGGFSFVEFTSTCNVNWKMKVLESKIHVHTNTNPIFPSGLFVDRMNINGKGSVDPIPVTHPQEVVE